MNPEATGTVFRRGDSGPAVAEIRALPRAARPARAATPAAGAGRFDERARPGGPRLPAAARPHRRRDRRRPSTYRRARRGALAPRRPGAHPRARQPARRRRRARPAAAAARPGLQGRQASTAASASRPSRRCATSSATSGCRPTAPAARPPSRRWPGCAPMVRGGAPQRDARRGADPPRRPPADRQDRGDRPRPLRPDFERPGPAAARRRDHAPTWPAGSRAGWSRPACRPS